MFFLLFLLDDGGCGSGAGFGSMDSDPVDPQTNGSYGSGFGFGSATLSGTLISLILRNFTPRTDTDTNFSCQDPNKTRYRYVKKILRLSSLLFSIVVQLNYSELLFSTRVKKNSDYPGNVDYTRRIIPFYFQQ
jgi:hypothetical protein